MTGIPVICDADPTSFKSLRALNRAIWSGGVTFDRDPQSGDAGLLALNHLGTGSGLGPRVAVTSPLRRILPSVDPTGSPRGLWSPKGGHFSRTLTATFLRGLDANIFSR